MSSCTLLTFNNICFDSSPLTCSQTSFVTSGSLCSGGRFTTTLSDYNCDQFLIRTTTLTQNCYFQPISHRCSSFATQTYSTATITRVALVTETNGCYYPLSEAHTYNEIITFQYGSINGIVAATPSPSPSPSPSPPPPQSPIVSTVATVTGNGNVSTSSVNDTSNILVIIIGVASAIVVIIAVIIGFVVVRRYANKNNNQAAAVPPPIQPIYDPYQTMNSNRPVSMMPSPGVQGAYYVPGSQQSSNYNPLMGGNPNFVNAAYPPPSEPQSAVMLSPVLPPKQ